VLVTGSYLNVIKEILAGERERLFTVGVGKKLRQSDIELET
jgi:hypothetical protein